MSSVFLAIRQPTFLFSPTRAMSPTFSRVGSSTKAERVHDAALLVRHVHTLQTIRRLLAPASQFMSTGQLKLPEHRRNMGFDSLNRDVQFAGHLLVGITTCDQP